MIFEDLLNNLKSEHCLRFNLKAEIEEQEQIKKYFLKTFPDVFSEVDPIDIHIPYGWKDICLTIFGFLNSVKAKVIKVKQKFGELRILSNDTDRETLRILQLATALSKSTCEFCGDTNDVSLFAYGYVCTVCKKCKDKIATFGILNFIFSDRQELNKGELYCLQVLREKDEFSEITE